MQSEQIIGIAVPELKVRLERETETWSNLDRNIIKYVKRRPNLYKENNIQNWEGSSEDRLNYLWNMFPEYKYYKLDVQSLHDRWLVIKTLYLYFSSRNINKNSKFFDGSLSFLNIYSGSESLQKVHKTRYSLPTNYLSDVTKEEIHLIPEITPPKTEISQLPPQTIHRSSYQTIYKPSAAKKTYLPKHRKKVDSNKPTASSQQHPKLEFYKPGSLVSGTLFEVMDKEDDMSEAEAFTEYKSKFCMDIKDEDMLVDEDIDTIFEALASSSSDTLSEEEITIVLNEGNNLASEEFVTLCQTGDSDSANRNNFEPLTETGRMTTSEDTRYQEVRPNTFTPFTDTRNFFREIGKYVANNFSPKEQNETRFAVWSLITAAEVKLLLENE